MMRIEKMTITIPELIKGYAEKSKDKRIILRKYKFLGWERRNPRQILAV